MTPVTLFDASLLPTFKPPSGGFFCASAGEPPADLVRSWRRPLRLTKTKEHKPSILRYGHSRSNCRLSQARRGRVRESVNIANLISFNEEPANTVSFASMLAASDTFKILFKDGMALVEESAAYLDGPGRMDSKNLSRLDSLSYASESMRLTTRLMQMASWLLLQRAVNEGELSPTQAASDKHKVKLSQQELATPPDQFDRLPAKLRDLCERSLRLQSRLIHLDRLLYAKPNSVETPPMGLRSQMERLQQAFTSPSA